MWVDCNVRWVLRWVGRANILAPWKTHSEAKEIYMGLATTEKKNEFLQTYVQNQGRRNLRRRVT